MPKSLSIGRNHLPLVYHLKKYLVAFAWVWLQLYIAIENGHRNSWFPYEQIVIFHRCLYVYQRVNQFWNLWMWGQFPNAKNAFFSKCVSAFLLDLLRGSQWSHASLQYHGWLVNVGGYTTQLNPFDWWMYEAIPNPPKMGIAWYSFNCNHGESGFFQPMGTFSFCSMGWCCL